MSADKSDDDGINITLGKLIAYPVGILLLLLGLAALFSSFVAGLLILLSGTIALPIVRSKLKEETGIGINRWAASAIVIVLMISGLALVPDSDGDENQDVTADSDEEPQLIEKSATDLTPSLEQFESGWRGSGNADGTASFSGPDGEQSVTYEISVYDSIDEAQSAVEEMNPDRISTESVNFGNGGFSYEVGDGVYRVVFSEKNVVCDTRYDSGIIEFTPKSNAEDHAEKCLESIRG